MSINNSKEISDVKVLLKVGADGVGIESVEKTGTDGLIDTYTITFTDGQKTTFTVTNGRGIDHIAKTSVSGNIDTYTIYYTDGTTWDFTISNGSGGGSLLNVSTPSSALFNKQVTLKKGTTVIETKTFDASGHVSFENVIQTGTLTLVSTVDGITTSSTVNITYYGVYEATMELMSATINLTAPSGAPVTCVGAGGSFSGTGSTTFTVHVTGQYTLSATVDGVTSTTTVNVTTDGQTINAEIKFGTINVTLSNDFIGVTITCTNGGTTIQKTATTTSLVFYPQATGSWTISGIVSGVTYSESVTIANLNTPVSVTLTAKAPMYSFSTCTDAQLSAMLNSYYGGAYDANDISLLKSTYMPIGAKRTIHLSQMQAGDGCTDTHFGASGADYEFVIIDQEHDDLTNSVNGKTKALLTLQMDRILYINTTDSTYTSLDSNGGGYIDTSNDNSVSWSGCKRRAWCNNTFFNSLPSTIKNLLRSVEKKTTAGNKSTSIVTTTDKVFFPALVETIGSTGAGYKDEGTKYAYYATAINLYKNPKQSGGVSASWWFRSPTVSSTNAWALYGGRYGEVNHVGMIYKYGLSPAFCL